MNRTILAFYAEVMMFWHEREHLLATAIKIKAKSKAAAIYNYRADPQMPKRERGVPPVFGRGGDMENREKYLGIKTTV